MIAQIFSVGTEILLGNITDTNSQFIATKLSELGIDVYRMVTVGDNYKRLYDEMSEADKLVDYIIVSGGLGPTPDDITKEVAIKVAQKEELVVVNEKAKKDLEKYFKNNQLAMKNNIKQAKFPLDAIILENKFGTAPGCIIETKNNTKIVLMPGPPKEMERMFNNQVLKYISREAIIESKILKIGLLGEWDMARRVNFEGNNPTVSPYFSDDGAYLRITAKADSHEECQKLISKKEKELDEIFGNLIISKDGQRKEKTLLDLLKDRNESISIAESITGGMIASSIVDIEGASQALKEAYVVYSDSAKEKILNVSHETLEKYSSVSKQAAEQMLDGLFEKTGSDLCIVTTGYAHTGLVYLGVKYKDEKVIQEFNFSADRNKVRLFTRNRAIDSSIIIMRGSYESYFNL